MRIKIPIFFLMVWGAALALGAGSSGARLQYEKALALEEAAGRLDEAIALFRKVVADAGSDEALAAQAQLHVGICYEKLARKEALRAYQAVIDHYPAQQGAVRAARERLTRLVAAAKPPRGTTVREFSRSPEPNAKGLSDPAQAPDEFAVTSDASTFIYADMTSGDLVVKDAATGKVRGLYGVDWMRSTELFTTPVISRDQKRVASISYWYPADQPTTNRINIDSVSGGSREIVYESDSEFVYPHDWSPDGSRILASLEAADRSVSLVTLGVKTRRVERLATLDWNYPARAEYSPDGRFIAYDSTKHGERKIYLMTADGREERVLVDSPGEDDSPLWSPDGRHLIFRSNRSGEWDLMALPIASGKPGGKPLLIKPNIGERTNLRSMTSDGRLFYGEQVSGDEIVLLERHGNSLGARRPLPAIKTRAVSNTSFASDGKRLVYLAGFRYGTTQRSLRIASLDGTILKEIPAGPELLRLNRAFFLPDGLTVAHIATDRKRERLIQLFSAESGAKLRNIVMEPKANTWIAGASPDGRYLYVTVSHKRVVHVERIDLETDERTKIPCASRSHHESVAVSPDGKFLLMPVPAQPQPGQDAGWKIVVRSLEDGSEKVLKEGVAGRMVWDFDSRHVFFKKGAPLFRLSLETGAEEVLWKDAGGHYLEAVSADGRLLAFRKPGADSRIWVVENFLPAKRTVTTAEVEK